MRGQLVKLSSRWLAVAPAQARCTWQNSEAYSCAGQCMEVDQLRVRRMQQCLLNLYSHPSLLYIAMHHGLLLCKPVHESMEMIHPNQRGAASSGSLLLRHAVHSSAAWFVVVQACTCVHQRGVTRTKGMHQSLALRSSFSSRLYIPMQHSLLLCRP